MEKLFATGRFKSKEADEVKVRKNAGVTSLTNGEKFADFDIFDN